MSTGTALSLVVVVLVLVALAAVVTRQRRHGGLRRDPRGGHRTRIGRRHLP